MRIGTFPEERPLAVFALCAGAGVLAPSDARKGSPRELSRAW